MDHSSLPSPREAYAQWTDACARAGWQPRGPAVTAVRVPLGAALGRVTAEAITARWPSPRCDCAAVDGIAINAEKSYNQGDSERIIAPGDFIWVDTGDPLPDGTDTVIMREHITIDANGSARVNADPGATPSRCVRGQGEDFGQGEVLVPEGRRLDPAGLAVAAAAGHAAIAVAARPRVAIIPTGDEIVPVGRAPKHGEITDSNSLYLAARCAQAGADARVCDIVPDDPDRLAAEIRGAAAGADLVLVIAGSSRGRGDHTAAVLAQAGGLIVTGVAVRPGHPALLGYAKSLSDGTVPVIGLPGYPLATAVIFELFAAPLLASLDGDAAPAPRMTARLARDWDSSPDIEDWVPVTLSPDGTVTPVRRGASSTSQLARASAWWPVPPGQGHFPAGSQITVLPFHRKLSIYRINAVIQ